MARVEQPDVLGTHGGHHRGAGSEVVEVGAHEVQSLTRHPDSVVGAFPRGEADQVAVAHEVGHVLVHRPVVQLLRGPDLLNGARPQDHEAVGQRQRLLVG